MMKWTVVVTIVFAVGAEPCVGSVMIDAASILRDVKRVESVREIKDIQRTFGQLAQYGKWNEMASLFAADGVLQWGEGKGDILGPGDAETFIGPDAIKDWLRSDAGDMDSIAAGSLHALLNDMPLITLSGDGRSGNGRWLTQRLLGDGLGGTRIEGGIFENEYKIDPNGRWKISLLRFYPLLMGDYENGLENAGNGTLPIVPYHFTPDNLGAPIMRFSSDDSADDQSIDVRDLVYRVSKLTEEDEVRNLQHAYGYYVDRRMWRDVTELFAQDGTMEVNGNTYHGQSQIQAALENLMGPERLTRGVLNEHPIFETIVEIGPSGRDAVSRGLEVGLLLNIDQGKGSWEFNVFRNTFTKDPDSGIWKIQNLQLARLLAADYETGWGLFPVDKLMKGDANTTKAIPPFLDVLGRSLRTETPEHWQPFWRDLTNTTEDLLVDLRRRLSRSAAYDETENVSAAYGYYLDDSRCGLLASIHAEKGSTQSPGSGWFRTREHIESACISTFGVDVENPRRSRVSFHWRTQPVIHVSQDGRSTSLRTRLLQLATASGTGAGFPGTNGLSGGMYHDQFVLEEGNSARAPSWKLWSLNIDEFYWRSTHWGESSGDETPRQVEKLLEHRHRQTSRESPIPDLSLTDPQISERAAGFTSGPTDPVVWPDIQKMWWSYRNPVSGRVPDDSYWAPGCVPCRTARPDWALMDNGYQEPPTGPTLVAASAVGRNITIRVSGGPEEPEDGYVEVRMAGRSANFMGWAWFKDGSASIEVDLPPGEHELSVFYVGNERLNPGRSSVVVAEKREIIW